MSSMRRTILRAMSREDKFGFGRMKSMNGGNRAERRAKKKKQKSSNRTK